MGAQSPVLGFGCLNGSSDESPVATPNTGKLYEKSQNII